MFSWFKRRKVLRQRAAIFSLISDSRYSVFTPGYEEAKMLLSVFILDTKPLSKAVLTDTLNNLNSKMNSTEYMYTDSVPELIILENGRLDILPSVLSSRGKSSCNDRALIIFD